MDTKNNSDRENTFPINFHPMPKRFMVWDTIKKKFLDNQGWAILPTQPDCGATLTHDDTSLYFADQQVIDWADADLLAGRYLICQSTNLFDKDGKEIFEGSIVMDLGYIVEGEPLVGVVISHPEVAAFTLRPRGGTISNVLVSKNSRYKVAGHILSNPELLEEK